MRGTGGLSIALATTKIVVFSNCVSTCGVDLSRSQNSQRRKKKKMLLRKLWGSRSVSSRMQMSCSDFTKEEEEHGPWPLSSLPSSSSGSRRSSSKSKNSSESFDQIQKIPGDVFVEILKLVGPKEAAKMSTVCKSWKFMVYDNNHLWIFFFQNHITKYNYDYWDAIVFSETYLSVGLGLGHGPGPGHPLVYQRRSASASASASSASSSSSLATLTPTPSLSYMHIYAKRAQLPVSVIIDGGSGYCKFGWSNHLRPSGRSQTFLEFGNLESPLYSRLRHFFTTVYSRMKVKPSSQPVVVSIPICHCEDTESAKAARKQLKETIYSVLFDMNIPSVCAINQAILALFAARRTSGIVVNIGFQVTSIVPIFQGKMMHKVGAEVVGQGAQSVTGFLRDLMQQKNIKFESMCTLRTLKENLCYVATDYEAELSKDTRVSLEVPEEGHVTLSEERFQTGEILFQPRMGGLCTMSLHQAVALCMDHCQDAEGTGDDNEWFKTVVLAGGTACLPGLPERLEKELQGILPPSLANGIKVIPPHSAESAWFGAKIISNLSSFREVWCITKKQFRKKSPRSN